MISLIKITFLLGSLLLCDAAALGPSDDTASNEPNVGRRIWGGNNAYYLYKSLAQIQPTFSDYITGYCSGMAISDRIILTSASCLTSNNKKPLFARVRIYGSDYVFWNNEILIHPDYTAENQTANIAALRISVDRDSLTRLSSDDFPTLINAQLNFHLEESTAIVVGWGSSSSNGYYDQRYANVNTITNENCKAIAMLFGGGDIVPQQVCTMDINKGTCYGDEGGPLLIKGRSVTYLVAITTNSVAACGKLGPVVYTRITPYQEWINELLKLK